MTNHISDSNKKIAGIVGVLFIVATATLALSLSFLGSIEDSNYLTKVSEIKSDVIIGILLILIGGIAIIGLAVLLFPVLKKHNKKIASGFLVFRIIEGALIILSGTVYFYLLLLSQIFVKAGTPDAAHFQTIGTLFLETSEWAALIGGTIVFSLAALMFNYSIYQSKILPRFLSIWGLIGATLLFISGMLDMFGFTLPMTISIFLMLPIALNEMVLALWLIVKGFNSSEIASK